MCQECRQYPCHPQCPNFEPKYICCCEQCGKEIYEGYEIWTDYDDNKFCSEDCAKDYHGIKEMDY